MCVSSLESPSLISGLKSGSGLVALSPARSPIPVSYPGLPARSQGRGTEGDDY